MEIYKALISDKDAKGNSVEQGDYLTNDTETTGYPYIGKGSGHGRAGWHLWRKRKEKPPTHNSHYTHQTQNGSKTYL